MALGASVQHRRGAIWWANVGLLVHVVLVAILLGTGHSPVWFLHLGRDARATVLAHRVLGPGAVTSSEAGHDGKEFWVLARDPLLTTVREVKPYLDRPPYRADRIGYPLLASPWRLAGEQGLVWGLILTNLAIAWAGTWVAARLAIRSGAPLRASMAFALCPGVIVSTALDLGDSLALACLLAVLLAVYQERWRVAVIAAAAATLTKEVFFLAAAGAAIGRQPTPFRRRLELLTIPPAVFLSWAVYVRIRLGWSAGSTGTDIGWPFKGYWTILSYHGPGPVDAPSKLIAIVVFAMAVAVVVLWYQRRTLLLSAALPMALLVPLLGPFVLSLPYNSMRVGAPLFTLLVLDAYGPRVASA